MVHTEYYLHSHSSMDYCTQYLFLLGLATVLGRVGSHYHDINDYVDINNIYPYEEDQELYDALESALNTPKNLYILRNEFFPTNQYCSRVLLIYYQVLDAHNGTIEYEVGWSDSGFSALLIQPL